MILVIFDLEGVLVKRGEHSTFDFICGGKKAVTRPFVEPFLDYLFSRPDVCVAVWTYESPERTQCLVQHIFGERAALLSFIWDRTHYRGMPLWFTSTRHPLRKVWEYYPQWNETNTLLVSNHHRNTNNCFYIQKYNPRYFDEEILRLFDWMEKNTRSPSPRL